MAATAATLSTPEAWRSVQTLVLEAWLSAFQLWDFLICVPAEVRRLYWPELARWVRSGQRPSLGSIFLLNTRLLTLPIIAMSAYSLGQPHKCQVSWSVWFTLTGLAHTNSAAIFAVRTIAIRSAGLVLKTILWIGVLAVAGANLWWAQTLHLAQAPATVPIAPTCSVLPDQVSLALWLPDAVILAFDTLVLLLTLHKAIEVLRPYGLSVQGLQDYRRSSSHLTRYFFASAIGWYLISMGILVAEVAWANTHPRTDLYQGLFIPFHVWTSVTIAPRVLREMKLRQAHEQHSLPQACVASPVCKRCGGGSSDDSGSNLPSLSPRKRFEQDGGHAPRETHSRLKTAVTIDDSTASLPTLPRAAPPRARRHARDTWDRDTTLSILDLYQDVPSPSDAFVRNVNELVIRLER